MNGCTGKALANYERRSGEEKLQEVEEQLARSFQAQMGPLLREAEAECAAQASLVGQAGPPPDIQPQMVALRHSNANRHSPRPTDILPQMVALQQLA